MKKLFFVFLIALACVAAAQDADDPVVIRFGDIEETRSDFDSRFEIAIRSLAAAQGIQLDAPLRAQLEGFKPQFLERRSTELVLLGEAQARGIEVEDSVVDEQVDAIKADLLEGTSFEDFLAGAGFTGEEQFRTFVFESQLLQDTVNVLQEEIEVTEEQIAGAYEARQEEFLSDEEICARHILLDTEEDAQSVLSDLEAGSDFATLAQERSTGPSGPTGGDLGCYGRGRMVPPFEEASFAAEVDSPVGPVETQFGFHVILVYEKTEAGLVALEDVSEQLEQSIREEQFATVMDALRAASSVEVFPEALAVAQELTEKGSESEEGTEGEESTEGEEGTDSEDSSEGEEGSSEGQ